METQFNVRAKLPGERRKRVRVWLTSGQYKELRRIGRIYGDGEHAAKWTAKGAQGQIFRDLSEKMLIEKMHAGNRVYVACLTPLGQGVFDAMLAQEKVDNEVYAKRRAARPSSATAGSEVIHEPDLKVTP